MELQVGCRTTPAMAWIWVPCSRVENRQVSGERQLMHVVAAGRFRAKGGFEFRANLRKGGLFMPCRPNEPSSLEKLRASEGLDIQVLGIHT